MVVCPPYTVLTPVTPTDPPAVWCDPHMLLVLAGLPETSENCALAVAAAEDATWVLDAMTGHQFHGPEQWREEYMLIDQCRLQLRQSPIGEIHTVTMVDSCNPAYTPVPVEWCLLSASKISLCPGAGGPMGWQTGLGIMEYPEYVDFPWRRACGYEQPHVMVEYDTKSTLPPGAPMAAAKLAGEKLKSLAGKPCQLPERVNIVTRQGVSWTVLDTQEFLVNGLTGVSQVDAFIVTARRARPNVHVTDPLYGRLVKSELLGVVGVEALTGPDRFDITLYQGDDFEMIVRFNTKDTPPVPIDVSDWTFSAQIRTDVADEEPVVMTEFTCFNDPDIANVMVMGLSAEQALELGEAGLSYRYDLESTEPSGTITTWLWGSVTIKLEVTRP